MTKITTFFGSLAISAMLAGPTMAQDATADTVVATVGDVEITLGEMIITRAQLPQQYQQLPASVLFQGVLDQLIEQQLLADSLAEVPGRVEYALRNERRTLLAGEIINEVTSSAASEEALQEAYEARFADSDPKTEYNASHLLVETEEEALAARTRIEEDEAFEAVARDVSTGPTGPNGGNLGWFGAGQMVTEFEDAVMNMDVGDLAGPVQTQFGWHVIKLNEKRIADVPPLDDLRRELTAELQEGAIQTKLEELREAADVVTPEEGAFDPEILTDLSLLEP